MWRAEIAQGKSPSNPPRRSRVTWVRPRTGRGSHARMARVGATGMHPHQDPHAHAPNTPAMYRRPSWQQINWRKVVTAVE